MKRKVLKKARATILSSTTFRLSLLSTLFVCVMATLPEVSNAQTAPTNLVYSVPTAIAYKKLPQFSVCPSVNNGGALVTYSLVSPPSGITIAPTTGQIAWDATIGVGTYLLTVQATNSVGSATANYTLNVMLNPSDYLKPKYTCTASTCTATYVGGITPVKNSENLVDVYLPAGDTNTHRPVFMFMHGGGFTTSNDKSQSYVVSFCKYMATCGYIAYGPNYNVGGGHTLAQNLLSCKDMNACLNSIRRKQLTGLTPATANFSVDTNYLFVGGGSAGAHLSCNFAFADNSTSYGGFMPNLTNVISLTDGWGSSPINTDRLYNFSSLNANSMPVFIVQGSADATVPVQMSIDLNNALNAVGSMHDFWEIAGETHGCPNHIPQISDSIAYYNVKAWKRFYPQTVNAVCVVTPVKLSFFGVSQKEDKVLAKWNTATEENVHYFELERSIDGINFVSVERTASNGNNINEYTYTDNVSQMAGTIYYRLKSVDNNGDFAFSEIESIDIKATKNIITDIYPNPAPANETLNVKYIAVKAGTINYQILNTIGQKIIANTVAVNEGNNKISLKLNSLKPGIYYLVILNNNSVSQRQTFIVK